jgi:hypothetical protein
MYKHNKYILFYLENKVKCNLCIKIIVQIRNLSVYLIVSLSFK